MQNALKSNTSKTKSVCFTFSFARYSLWQAAVVEWEGENIAKEYN